MSSFISKRAEREAKQSKSFISESGQPSSQDHDDDDESESFNGQESSRVDISGFYADLPPSLEVRQNKSTGRGIWAKQAIKKGSILFAQRPEISVLSTKNLAEYCSYCVRSSSDGSLKRCSKCKVIWYCSPKCQNLDWPMHKHECPAISTWTASAPDGSPPGEAIRTLGRILWGRKVWGESSTWWKEVQMLYSHRGSLPSTATETHIQLARALVRYLGVTSPAGLSLYGLSTPGDLVDLISRFTINTLTLTSPTLLPLGTCVSPVTALLNHSCDPSAVFVFPRPAAGTYTTTPGEKKCLNDIVEPRLHIVAIKDIRPGEEIFTAYVDTTSPAVKRQQMLKETYNFSCTCILCLSVTTGCLDPREAVLCPKSCGGLCPAPYTGDEDSKLVSWRCSSCKSSCTPAAIKDIEEKRRIGQDALDKATKLQFSDRARALTLTSNMIPLLGTRIPPSAQPLLGLLGLQVPLLIDTLSTAAAASNAIDEAIRTAGHVVSGLSAVLCEGHPARGLAMAELGKLLAMDEPPTSSTDPATSSSVFPPTGPRRLALAVEMLKKAFGELTIGFGEATGGGEAGRNVRQTIIGLEKEMDIWRQGIKYLRDDAAGMAMKTK